MIFLNYPVQSRLMVVIREAKKAQSVCTQAKKKHDYCHLHDETVLQFSEILHHVLKICTAKGSKDLLFISPA